MFPSLLESFGKISMGTSQDSQDKISEKVSGKSSTDPSRPGLLVVQTEECTTDCGCDPASNMKCLIKAGLNITLRWRPQQNADNSERIMMMSRSAFVMTYFLPDFHTRKNSPNIYNVQIKMFIQASPHGFWKQIFQFHPKKWGSINLLFSKNISSVGAQTYLEINKN